LRDARSDLAHLREEAERARHFAALPGTDRSPL
jgi:hypothetical protein